MKNKLQVFEFLLRFHNLNAVRKQLLENYVMFFYYHYPHFAGNNVSTYSVFCQSCFMYDILEIIRMCTILYNHVLYWDHSATFSITYTMCSCVRYTRYILWGDNSSKERTE